MSAETQTVPPAGRDGMGLRLEANPERGRVDVYMTSPGRTGLGTTVEAADLRRALDALAPESVDASGLDEPQEPAPYPEFDHDHRRTNILRDAADVLSSVKAPAAGVSIDSLLRLADWITEPPPMVVDLDNGLAPEDPQQGHLFTPAVMAVEEVDEVLAQACREGYGSVRELLIRALEGLGVVVNR